MQTLYIFLEIYFSNTVRIRPIRWGHQLKSAQLQNRKQKIYHFEEVEILLFNKTI